MFLAERREDKVSVRNRQELQLCLSTMGYARSPHAAMPDGDSRLNDLVSAAARILGRIEEGSEPGALIVVEHIPTNRQRYRKHDYQDGQVLPANARQENTRGQHRHICEGGTEIRLLSHENH